MNMAYLSNLMDNILIQNGEFKIDESSGMVTFNPEISIKLCDLSLTEIFRVNSDCNNYGENAFQCKKHCFIGHSQHSSPLLFSGQIYNAKKQDIWSCGMLLYGLTFHSYPFLYQNHQTDSGYFSIKNGQLQKFIHDNNLSKYTTKPMLSLISSLLCYDQNQRIDSLGVLQSEWLNSYWNKYKVRITKKSFSQRERLQMDKQRRAMANYPYYRR